MSIFLPALGVTFAAFGVWLAVRIINRRERWAKWTAVALVAVPVLYVLSFGPACWAIHWLRENGGLTPTARVSLPFVPLGRLARGGPIILARPLVWYAAIGIPEDEMVIVPIGYYAWGVVSR